MVRSMPNTSSKMCSGATLFSPGHSISSEQLETIHRLFSSVGYCQKVDEKYLDVITGLSGCGPSYVSDLYVIYNFMIPRWIKYSRTSLVRNFSPLQSLLNINNTGLYEFRIRRTHFDEPQVFVLTRFN